MNIMLLWDIDGTLVNTARAGIAALEQALEEMGLPADASVVEIAGRTDRAIMRSLLERYNRVADPEALQSFSESYLSKLTATVQQRQHEGRVFEGVKDLIAEGFQRGWAQGLVTGNLVQGAEIKLRAYSIWDMFCFGAFGDDSENRNDLPPIAVSRAVALGVPIANKDRTWIIGDTPHDVRCARSSGFRCLGVATGQFSTTQLMDAGADFALPDLKDTKKIISICENG